MNGGDEAAARLTPAEARAALKAVTWFILHAPDSLMGPDGAALLATRDKLAAAVSQAGDVAPAGRKGKASTGSA